MKRYLLFAWHDFTATGGWNDFVADYDNIEDAKNFIGHDSKLDRDNAIIVDINNKNIILTGIHKYDTYFSNYPNFYYRQEDWKWDEDSKNEEFIKCLIINSYDSPYDKLIEECKNKFFDYFYKNNNIDIEFVILEIVKLIGIYSDNYKEGLKKFTGAIEPTYSSIVSNVLFDLDEIYELNGQLKNYSDIGKYIRNIFENFIMGA